MEAPSKESIIVLRRFLSTPQIKEVLAYLRANPPRVSLDPALHVYAHSAGVRDGWNACIDRLEEISDEKPEQRAPRDTIES